MAILMILRCYLILRLIPNLSKWTDIHAEECCEREGIRANFVFALKCLLKEKPYVMLLTYFALSIFGFAFSVRISEITCMTMIPPTEMWKKTRLNTRTTITQLTVYG